MRLRFLRYNFLRYNNFCSSRPSSYVRWLCFFWILCPTAGQQLLIERHGLLQGGEAVESESVGASENRLFDQFQLSSFGTTDDIQGDPRSQPISRFRKGFFQGGQFSSAQVGAGSDLATTTMELNGGFAVPLGSFDNLLAVTPTFRADLIQTEQDIDVPTALYETGVRFFHRKELSDVLSTTLLVSPLIRSDFTTSDNAVRIFGLALLSWEAVPAELTLSGGAVFLGRDDLPVLPAVGLRWTPEPRWRLDLQFPQPRLSYLISKHGSNSEQWIYLGGALGGSTWAVTRDSGESDDLTLRDYRFVVGVEQLLAENRGGFLEIGWVFGRSMEYTNSSYEQEFDDSFVLRAGLSF